MYNGDFATAIAEASRVRTENPTLEYAFLPIALSKLADGDVAGARQAYAGLSAMSPFGASLAKLGEADLHMYFGHHRTAIGVLRAGIDADVNGKIPSVQVARKYVALADAYLASAQPAQAAVAATEAIKSSRAESILFPAALALLRAGRPQPALQIASDLEKMLQAHTTAYARMISGAHAFARGRMAEGVEQMRDAQKRRDSWFSRFLLGKAYVEAGQFTEGLAELEPCVKRRGETTDVFIDDLPTLRYLPPAYYWLARAQEATGAVSDARTNYDAFLKLRADADPRDPLAADAQKRVAALTDSPSR
jgi:tetratricopeptide (TPR) repeat protein